MHPGIALSTCCLSAKGARIALTHCTSQRGVFEAPPGDIQVPPRERTNRRPFPQPGYCHCRGSRQQTHEDLDQRLSKFSRVLCRHLHCSVAPPRPHGPHRSQYQRQLRAVECHPRAPVWTLDQGWNQIHLSVVGNGTRDPRRAELYRSTIAHNVSRCPRSRECRRFLTRSWGGDAAYILHILRGRPRRTCQARSSRATAGPKTPSEWAH